MNYQPILAGGTSLLRSIPPGSNLMFMVIGATVFAYIFPFIVAVSRGKNPGGVFILNLVIGWSVIGWIIALVMACGQKERRPQRDGLLQAIGRELAERRAEKQEIRDDAAWHASCREPRL